MSNRCACCHRRFPFRPQNPDQKYCGLKACQNARRHRWRRAKMQSDAAYRANQQDSQRRWLDKVPGYWSAYRAAHREYVERNRALQKQRDRLKRELASVTRSGAVLAKSDACPEKSDAIAAYYELLPATDSDLAKRYASKRIFKLIPVGYSDFMPNCPSCKEITRGTSSHSSDRACVCPGPSP